MSIWPPHSWLDTSRRLSCIGFSVRHFPVRCQLDECLQLPHGYDPPPSTTITIVTCNISSWLAPAGITVILTGKPGFQHISVGSWWIHNLAPFLKESESPFRHSFLIPLWACRSWHRPTLKLFSTTTNLMPDYLSPLSSLATIWTELLLTDYFHALTLHGLKRVQRISEYPTPLDSSSTSPPASQNSQTPQICMRLYSPCFLICDIPCDTNHATVTLHLSDAKMMESCCNWMSGKNPTT